MQMKHIKNLGKKLNSTQKIVVAITVPLILLIISLVIADAVGSGPFDLDDTFLIWILFIGIVGYFEFHLFSEQK